MNNDGGILKLIEKVGALQRDVDRLKTKETPRAASWAAYTPTITYTGGSGTPTLFVPIARYHNAGGLVHLLIVGQLTRGTCTQTIVKFTAPTDVKAGAIAQVVHTLRGAAWKQGLCIFTDNVFTVELGGAMSSNGFLRLSAFYEEK